MNYGSLDNLARELNRNKKSLEDISKALDSIHGLLIRGKGETTTAFHKKIKGYQKKIKGVQSELTDLLELIQGYKTDMTSIMKPI